MTNWVASSYFDSGLGRFLVSPGFAGLATVLGGAVAYLAVLKQLRQAAQDRRQERSDASEVQKRQDRRRHIDMQLASKAQFLELRRDTYIAYAKSNWDLYEAGLALRAVHEDPRGSDAKRAMLLYEDLPTAVARLAAIVAAAESLKTVAWSRLNLVAPLQVHDAAIELSGQLSSMAHKIKEGSWGERDWQAFTGAALAFESAARADLRLDVDLED